MAAPTNDDRPALEIDWLKTVAGALAAVTTAVLLSTLGAVGTLVGAALGSVAATVGSAVYAQGLARSRQAVLKAQETALHKVGIAQAEVRRAARRDGEEQEAHLELADERLAEAKEDLDVAEPTRRQRLAGLPWKRIAVWTAATFAVVVLAITAFEAVAGRSVSSYTGGSSEDQGTTIGGVRDDGGRGGKPDRPDQPEQSPSGSESPSEEASDEASDEASESPGATPSESPSVTSTPPSPTESATPTPSLTPSGTPPPTPTP